MYFVNLAVKTKLHLDNPRAEGADRQLLLDYYDMFPRLPKYKDIEAIHFAKKPLRASVQKKTTRTDMDEIEEFGEVADETEEEEEGGEGTS